MTVVSSMKTAGDYIRYFVQEAKKREVYFGHATLVDYMNLIAHRPMDAKAEAIEILCTVLNLPNEYFQCIEDNEDEEDQFDSSDDCDDNQESADEDIYDHCDNQESADEEESFSFYYDQDVNEEQVKEILAYFEQRLEARKPLAYIQGYACLAEDYGFTVNEHVAIPRSPIAQILHENLIPWDQEESIQSVLDLCTGCGALAIFAAQCCYLAEVHAIDNHPEAIALAQQNCENYAATHLVTLHQGDLFTPLKVTQKFDLILANPPYVPTEEMANLPPEFHYEPVAALAAGVGGLDFVDRILKDSIAHLTPKGIVLFDIGMPENRPRIEAAYPNLALNWIKTGRGNSLVFSINAETLQAYFTPTV